MAMVTRIGSPDFRLGFDFSVPIEHLPDDDAGARPYAIMQIYDVMCQEADATS
jgi:hypothetical protein